MSCREFSNDQNKSSNASVRYEMSSQQSNASNSSSSNRSTYCRCEIRYVIRFLTLRNESAASIHRQLVETYGSEVMTRQYVTKRIQQFEEGRTDTHDEERCGRLSVILDELLQQVEEKVKKGYCWSILCLKESP